MHVVGLQINVCVHVQVMHYFSYQSHVEDLDLESLIDLV